MHLIDKILFEVVLLDNFVIYCLLVGNLVAILERLRVEL